MSDTDITQPTPEGKEAAAPAAAPKKPSAPKKPATPKPEVKAEEKAEEKAGLQDIGSMLGVASATQPVEEETVSMGLPPTMEFNESVKGTINGNAFTLNVYAEGCFECSSLVPSLADPGEKGTEPECHFRFGNPYCPAGYHRIQIVGARVRLLHAIKKAKRKADSNMLLKQMSKIDALSLEDKTYVLRELGLLEPEAAEPEAVQS